MYFWVQEKESDACMWFARSLGGPRSKTIDIIELKISGTDVNLELIVGYYYVKFW